jgi:sulfite exporter TauE/SafE
MNSIILISAFVLGIGGSLHCIGMCGPLALSIPFSKESKQKWISITIYYTFKAIAYGVLGIIMGALGKGIMLMNYQQILSIIAGVFIILMAFKPYIKTQAGNFFFQKQFSAIYQNMVTAPRWWYYAALGFLNGWLPCGMVYTALATAAVSGSGFNGFATMFVFGLGTTPALWILTVFKSKISIKLRSQLKPIVALTSILIGVVLIIRGMNLGLPYLSPIVENNSVKQCCAKPHNP